jgi:lysophospholipase L1-like esterase
MRTNTMLLTLLTAGGVTPDPALSRWRTAIADAENTPVSILALGTSITEGANITTLEGRWTSLLRDKLRVRLGLPAGGQGYVKSNYGTTPGTLPEPWTLVGAATNGETGLGGRDRELTTTKTMAFTFDGTGLRLYYSGYSGGNDDIIGVQIDGGAVTQVNTQAASLLPMRFWDSAALASGEHTVILSRVTGTVYIDGILIYDGDEDSGIWMFEGGRSAGQISYYTTSTPATYMPHWVGQIQPALVLIESPMNEWFFGTTPSTWITNLTALVLAIRSASTPDPSIMLVFPYERGAGGSTGARPYQEYITAGLAYAASDGNISVCNMVTAFGSQPWTPGLVDVDQSHPTATGSELWAETLVDQLLP